MPARSLERGRQAAPGRAQGGVDLFCLGKDIGIKENRSQKFLEKLEHLF